MWKKSKYILNSHIQSSMNYSFRNSWEEQASGPLEGSIWLPRSYPCNFCKREFRSAQALGGHMNVHRRDRARLMHLFSLHSKLPPHDHDQNHHNQQSDQSPSLAASISVISTQQKESGGDESVSYKRYKASVSSQIFMKQCLSSTDHRYSFQSEVVGALKHSSMEDLDLELRLGDPPKAK